jgi:hypothetical protein
MVERWFVSRIFLKAEEYGNRDSVLLDAIKPAIEALENEKLIQTFHFLFEPNFEILLRVRLNDDVSMERVTSIVADKLKPIEQLCDQIESDENYTGEGDPKASYSFGSEGWIHTQKFLECGSRIALLMREVSGGKKPLEFGRLDSQFNIGKLEHCFLNQCGYGVTEEANFHIDRYFERGLVAWGYFDALERIKKLEEQLGNF